MKFKNRLRDRPLAVDFDGASEEALCAVRDSVKSDRRDSTGGGWRIAGDDVLRSVARRSSRGNGSVQMGDVCREQAREKPRSKRRSHGNCRGARVVSRPQRS